MNYFQNVWNSYCSLSLMPFFPLPPGPPRTRPPQGISKNPPDASNFTGEPTYWSVAGPGIFFQPNGDRWTKWIPFGWLFFVETGDPRRQKSLGIRGHCRHRRRSSKSKWLETLPETNRCDIAPENQWLEDVFPIYVYTYYIETVPFWGTCEFSAPFIASLGV